MSEPLDLEPIKAREKAATPGPWLATEDGGWSFGGPEVDRGGRPNLPCTWVERESRTGEGDAEEIARVRTSPDHQGLPEAWENQRFIAASRSDVPALVAEVERLREALASAESLTRTTALQHAEEKRSLEIVRETSSLRLVRAETAGKAIERVISACAQLHGRACGDDGSGCDLNGGHADMCASCLARRLLDDLGVSDDDVVRERLRDGS